MPFAIKKISIYKKLHVVPENGLVKSGIKWLRGLEIVTLLGLLLSKELISHNYRNHSEGNDFPLRFPGSQSFFNAIFCNTYLFRSTIEQLF